MSKHTPGPWTTTVDDDGDGFRCDGPNGERIINGCGCCGSPWMAGNEPKADARLIAAAPDLVDIVRDIVSDCNGAINPGLYDLAVAALAKAEGTDAP